MVLIGKLKIMEPHKEWPMLDHFLTATTILWSIGKREQDPQRLPECPTALSLRSNWLGVARKAHGGF